MFHRFVNTPQSNNFFLFGARSTGKSKLLASRYPNVVVIDLLDASEERYGPIRAIPWQRALEEI